jgi:hypothetical protein
MATEVGISGSTVQQLRLAHGLQPHRALHGIFRSVRKLQAAINRFLDETNATPKRFCWVSEATFLDTKDELPGSFPSGRRARGRYYFGAIALGLWRE